MQSPEPDHLFREKAIHHASSPEQLDQVVKIASPKSWAILTAILIVIVFALFWFVFGEVEIAVSGEGVLLKRGGVKTLTPGFSGRVTAVHASAGETVTPNQLLLTVHQPGLMLQLQNARQILAFLQAQALTRSSDTLQVQLAEQAAKVRELEAVLNTSTTLRSPGHIRLLELNVTADDLIQDDDVIAIYERAATGDLYLEAFVPVVEGKEIRPGAMVQVIPNAIRQENAGYIQGTVRWVSEFPASPENLKATLRNEDLVSLLTAHGSYTKVTIDLPSVGNGMYKWSVKNHPPVSLSPGTICQIRIVTDRVPPYRFVLP